MPKISHPNEFAALINKADKLQRQLDELTIAKQPTGALLPQGDGQYLMVPDSTLATTRLRTQQLDGKQRMLERSIRVAESELKRTVNESKKQQLAAVIADAKESLAQIVQEKVSVRALNLSEVLELQSRYRKQLNEAVRSGNQQAVEAIRQKLVELNKDRRRRGSFTGAI